ncbi:MAG: PAS domain S-box protein [Candidatus Omnitrophota bacterium]|nr:PAS domain S-box protein [Candidatus Omnitrophota bacterium]
MSKRLKILLLEDSPDDAELIARELRRGNIDFVSKRVDSRKDFLKELKAFAPDIVSVDYRLPVFDGITALSMVKEISPSTPVIIVTGSINEEVAVECMKAGAADYVLKDRLTRLASAVRSALAKRSAERKINMAHKTTHSIIKNAPFGICVVNKEGNIDYVNPAMLEIAGDNYEKFKGMNVFHDLPGYKKAGLVEKIKAGLKGEYFKIGSVEYTSEFGKKTTVRNFTGIPLEEDGEKKLLMIVEDVTGRKLMEKALRDSEERFRMMFECAPDAYFLEDLKGKFIEGNKNAEKLTGYRKEELAGKSLLDLISPDQIPLAKEILAKNAKKKTTGPDEFVLHRKDESEVVVEISTYPVVIRGETLVLSVARDVTKREKMEKKTKKHSPNWRFFK